MLLCSCEDVEFSFKFNRWNRLFHRCVWCMNDSCCIPTSKNNVIQKTRLPSWSGNNYLSIWLVQDTLFKNLIYIFVLLTKSVYTTHLSIWEVEFRKWIIPKMWESWLGCLLSGYPIFLRNLNSFFSVSINQMD